jgi:hypothetical protein
LKKQLKFPDKYLHNTFPIFTNSLAVCGTIWSTLACRTALYNQDTTTVSFLFLVEFLDFSDQILHTLKGCAFLPVGDILSAMCFPKSLLLDSACETSVWASVTPFSANPLQPSAGRKLNNNYFSDFQSWSHGTVYMHLQFP